VTATVLVLNSTYEPLSFTKLGRAVAMILRGEAVAEEVHPTRVIRHQSGEMPWPKVLRLLRYVKLQMETGPAQWCRGGVLRRDDYTCGYCGRTATTVDHIIPTSKGGGRRDWLNTVAACAKCNHKKRDRTPEQAHMTLHVVPTVPMKTHLRIKVRRT